ncbi:Arm DNA-binding domain-containing protein [Achromobacter sp. D10]|uniref:Arm DNA-binding domain-containing protein n=1 Tax=Achromobacter sp. D10 TaxID=3110765 RepID=UPI002B4738D6|nr:Arm DNA-binding domain-containing protein [Achromobacter sp. D10]MEB3095592.1 Arm DNA-binding domain-containing protein [Achromobacter sp. D10]
MTNDPRLTKRLIDSLDEPGLYWDSQLRGFGLQISGTTKTYVVQARINGKSSRQKIARHGVLTPEQARDEARQRLAQMAAGIDPRQARRALSPQGVTLKDALDAYFANRELAPRTQADYRKVLADHLSCWQSTPLTSISQDMVELQHAKLGESHGHAQANMAMRLLKAVFNFAEGKYQRADGSPLVTTNPTKRLNALRRWYKTPRRENYIREEQLQAWHAGVLAMSDASPTEGTRIIQDYLLFVLFTGLRRTEAASIQW